VTAALLTIAGAVLLAGWALADPTRARKRPRGARRIGACGRSRRTRPTGARNGLGISRPLGSGGGPAGVRHPAAAPGSMGGARPAGAPGRPQDGHPTGVPPGWRGLARRGAAGGPRPVALLVVAAATATMTIGGARAGIAVGSTAGIVLAASRARRRSAERRLRAARAEAAPAVIDLLGACLLAGLNPYLALRRVAERSPQALRTELGRMVSDLDLGSAPGAALRAAAERSGLDELRAAAGALEVAERWGMPPAEALAARAEALRSRSRLRAEAEAGRAAVRLAFPLVFCFLPAFVLLTVVPTVAGAVRALTP
jgi:tight adherence protein C